MPYPNLPLMSCHTYNPRKVKYPCLVQPKLRGIRARYYQDKFYSRDNNVWNDNVVAHMVGILHDIFPDMPPDVMLDGEFYFPGFSQGQHTSAVGITLLEPNNMTYQIDFYVFDFWKARECPSHFTTRYAILLNNNVPNLVQVSYIQNKTELDAYYEMIVNEQNGEGIIIIMQDCEYIDGKSHYKLKRKKFHDMELKCIGVERGRGRHLNRMGSILCYVAEGKSVNIGSGFTDKERELYFKRPELILDKMVTIQYQELSEDGIPQIPTFVSIRNYE